MTGGFASPGSDGVDPGTGLWRKGIVYTTHAATPAAAAGYRVTAAIKRGVPAGRPFTGFPSLYQRVSSIASQRMAELAGSSVASIQCQGWRTLGDTGAIATAFLTLAAGAATGEPPPSDEDLRAPGGATLEDLARLAPQQSDEVFNEFDFADGTANGLVTVSYGESVPASQEGVTDFEPFVHRAERFAASYLAMLERLGEARGAFQVKHRAWFLASPRFVTVHICF